MAKVPLILRLLISLGYLIVAGFVVCYRPFQAPIFDFGFALASAAYGVFRGYRAWDTYRSENEAE